MNEKIIELEVKPERPGETTEAAGGTMFEHNATVLSFCLSPEYCLPEYKYYLEFVTVHGILRTDYLVPNEAHKIIFSIPQEVTSQMTALAVLNIAAFDANGNTTQLIKSKTVRLYFSNLENVDKTLCENYAFSVNQLLEAIKNGTFKGEKGEQGEQGETYSLVSEDYQKISDLIAKKDFGLPLYTKAKIVRKAFLKQITNEPSLHMLMVYPGVINKPLKDVKVTFGTNSLEHAFVQTSYRQFKPGENGYSDLNIYVRPNEEYTLSTRNAENSTITAQLFYKNKAYPISKAAEPIVAQEQAISIGEESTALFQVKLPKDPADYQKACETEWEGITLTSNASTRILKQTFSEPLYFLDEHYVDTFDFLSGMLTRRTAKLVLQEEMIADAPDYTLKNGSETLYGYNIFFPPNMPTKAYEIYVGSCNHLPIVPNYMWTDDQLLEAIQNGDNVEGICIDTWDNVVAIYSKKSSAELKAFLREASTQNDPVEVIYPREFETEEIIAVPQPNYLPPRIRSMCVAPYDVVAEVEYTIDLSKKHRELEERLSALENRMNGENM